MKKVKQRNRRGASPVIPNERYVDHSNAVFHTNQLTSTELSNLRLYHQSNIGGPFPMKLQILLKMAEELGFQDIVSWLPHGRAFIINRPCLFEKEIMSRFFDQTKFSSFKRQLNLYDFKRITHHVDSGAYYHEMFLRTKPLLAMKMTRRKIKGKIRVSTHICHEPKFYSMPVMDKIKVNKSSPRDLKPYGKSFLPAGEDIQGNRNLLHSEELSEQGDETRLMPSRMMMVTDERGYLDRFHYLATPFSRFQSGASIASPYYTDSSSDLSSTDEQYYYPSHSSEMLSLPQGHSGQEGIIHYQITRNESPHQHITRGTPLKPSVSQNEQQCSSKKVVRDTHPSSFELYGTAHNSKNMNSTVPSVFVNQKYSPYWSSASVSPVHQYLVGFDSFQPV